MKLAYVTTYDATDVRHWSGMGFFIGRALRAQELDLAYMGPLRIGRSDRMLERGRQLGYRLAGRKYLITRTTRVAAGFAGQITEGLTHDKFDLIFSPGSIPISLLDCAQPIVFWTDATFAGMLDYYPEYTNLCEDSQRQGHALEQGALERCRFAIYGSEWAARTALENYKVGADKIKVVPFGANIESGLAETRVREVIAGRSRQTCKLLFISVAWQRKGGDRVLEILEHLRGLSLPAELSIVGEIPPVPLPEHVRFHGFISKSAPEGIRRLEALFEASHFLIAPSRAEAFGLVVAEANAFAVPAITSNTGGLGSVIRDGINGQKFGLDAPASEYADFIARLWADRAAYADLALSSHREFQQRLNWNAAGAQVRALLEAAL